MTEQQDTLLIVPVPSLVATLLNRERAKGSALTEAEVLALRDAAPSIAMPRDVVEEMNRSRGYADIVPENVWAEWQKVRLDLQ